MLSAHRLSPSLSADLLYQFPHRPHHFFLIKKSGSSHVDSLASTLASYLHTTHHLTVYIEASVHSTQSSLFPQCLSYTPSLHRHTIDVVITLGGDGTALHFNTLFNDSHTIPMLLSFSMGTLGFLTPFDFKDHPTIITQLLKAFKKNTQRNDRTPQVVPPQTGGEGVEGKGAVGAKEVAEDAVAEDDGEYVISLCPRMRLLCQVWKKKKKPHAASTPEARLARNEARRRRRKLSHGISDDDDSTSSEDEEEVAQREKEKGETPPSEQPLTDGGFDVNEEQRRANIEARQGRIDEQRVAEQQIVQRADASTSNPSPPSTAPRQPAGSGQVYLAATFHPLNELLLSGHTNRSLTSIDLSLIQEDGKHAKVSTVLADALIISTATGSTAYSMSAGGPMVSPNAHCIIITPVCPHTLSFRPLILPDSTHLLLGLSDDSRSKVGQILCDGVAGRRLRKEEWVTVRQDNVPVWSVNYVSRKRDPQQVKKERDEGDKRGDGDVEEVSEVHVDSSVLWFRSISSKLFFNTRQGVGSQITSEMKENAVDSHT